MMDADALVEIEMRIAKCLPIQPLEIEVMRKVYAEISACPYSPARVLELFLVHIDRYTGIDKVFEAACMIEMQVSEYDRLDVLDVISCRSNRIRELVLFAIFDPWEQISDWSRPFLR